METVREKDGAKRKNDMMEFQTPRLDVEDISALEEKYNTELLKGNGVSKSTTFEYAWALVQSQYKQDIERGVDLFEGMVEHCTWGV